jgi:DNA-binding transcriptional MocR family regulator
MTTWKPNLEARPGPIYMAIVASLAEDIAAGRLCEGVRLPTHRDLADALGVTVGTITRAYAEAQRRHLVAGEVGRGTFVRQHSPLLPRQLNSLAAETGMTDLSLARPVAPLAPDAFALALREVAEQSDLRALLDYQPDGGMPAHRSAIAEWVRPRGLSPDPDQVVLTCGAQHALCATLAALAHPDDTVLCEALTYPGVKAAADVLHLRLQGIATDEDGVIPALFERACRAGAVRALYLIPTLQNPTSSVMPLERRQKIVEIARSHDVILVEDDVYGFLAPDAPPPIATLAPERTVYLASFSKLVAGGLRVGYAVAPPGLARRVAYGVHATAILAAPVQVELAVRLLRDGTALRQMELQRSVAGDRQRLAAERLAGLDFQARPTGSIVWLSLPPPWQADAFAAQAREQGVLVSPAPLFHAGRGDAPAAVRIGLGGAGADRLDGALRLIAKLARSTPEAAPRIV